MAQSFSSRGRGARGIVNAKTRTDVPVSANIWSPRFESRRPAGVGLPGSSAAQSNLGSSAAGRGSEREGPISQWLEHAGKSEEERMMLIQQRKREEEEREAKRRRLLERKGVWGSDFGK